MSAMAVFEIGEDLIAAPSFGLVYAYDWDI
jgi:hypothetical protein